MTRRAEEIVSIRLPKGLKDEIRAETGMHLSTLTRHLLVTFINHKRGRAKAAEFSNVPTESKTDD